MKKTALVIGGTTGLGQEIARIAATNEYKVTVAGRTAESCELVAKGAAIPMVLDLEKRYWRPAMPDPQGLFDLIVWAAGMQQRGPFTGLTTDEIRRHCRVQFEAPVETLAELLQAQKKTQHPTHLVVISSTTSWRVRGDELLYGALKAAQSHLARGLGVALQTELPRSKVMLVNPGGMMTPFWKNSKEDTTRFMNPATVAKVIWTGMHLQNEPFEEIQILRQPDGTPRFERGSRPPTF